MKHIFSLGFILFSLMFFQCSTTSKDFSISDNLKEQIETEIKAVMSFQEKAWNDGNIPAFMEGCWKSEKLRFTGSNGVTYGWKNTLENYKRGYPNTDIMGKLSFDILEIDVLTSVDAVMLGRYTLVRKLDEPTGLFTLIWKKVDGTWRITSDMTCG